LKCVDSVVGSRAALVSALMLSLLVLSPISAAVSEPSLSVVVRVLWRAESTPVQGVNWAYAVCGYGGLLYVFGHAGWNARIEARNPSNGSLIETWNLSSSEYPRSSLMDCTVINGTLYGVGFAMDRYGGLGVLLVKASPDLSHINYTVINLGDVAVGHSITSDDRYLYVAGYTGAPGDFSWMVLKVDPVNLSVIGVRTVNPSLGSDAAFSVGFCPENGVLWVAGGVNLRVENVGEAVSEQGEWMIALFDENLNNLSTLRPGIGGKALSVAVNGSYVYVAGWGGLAKYRCSGSLERLVEAYLDKISVIGGFVVGVGSVYADGVWTAVLEVYDFNLTRIYTANITENGITDIGRMHSEGGVIYFALWRLLGGDSYGWEVYAVKVEQQKQNTESTERSAPTTYVFIALGLAVAAAASIIVLRRAHSSKSLAPPRASS